MVTNLDDALQTSVIQSVAGRLNGFFYRCQNDSGYTMLFMTGGVEGLSGYPPSDFLNNSVRTFSSVISPEDIRVVNGAVNAGVEAKGKWDVDYRIIKRDGTALWTTKAAPVFLTTTGSCFSWRGCASTFRARRHKSIS